MTTTPRGRHRRLRRNIARTIVAISLLSGTFTVVDQSVNPIRANAAAGDPGTSVVSYNSNLSGASLARGIVSVAKQSDGKVLALSDTGRLVRFNLDGTPDSTFNSTIATSFSSVSVSGTYEVVVQSDGKILVADTSGAPLQRFNADGTADTAFNTKSNTALSNGQGYAIAVQPDGKILLGGYFLRGGSWLDGLRRYNADGSFDTTFNSTLGTNVGYRVYAVKVQSDGKILLGGSFTNGLMRLNSDGTLDTSFNTNVGTRIGSNVQGIAINSSGLIAVASVGNGYLKFVNSDGTAGITQTAVTGNAYALQFDSLGRLYVSGSTATSKIARVLTDGTADPNFLVTTSTFNANSYEALALLDDGNLLIGGSNTPYLAKVYTSYATPDPPTITSVNANSNGTATIAVAGNGSVTTTKITVTSSPGAKTCEVTGSTGTCIVTGLTLGTSYTFTAIATNVTQDSVASQVSNSISAFDGIAPVLQTAVINASGDTLTLTYDESISQTVAQKEAFTVLSGTGYTIGVTGVTVSGNSVVLSLAPIAQQDRAGISIKVNYQPATDSGLTDQSIQDASGNNSLALTNFAITNNSIMDTIGPSLIGSKLDAGGQTLTLTFDELLATSVGATPLASSFTITADGSPITVSGISVSGTTVTLTLANRVYADQLTTIEYLNSSPVSGTGNSAIQDQAGNDSLTISATPVESMDSPVQFCTSGGTPTPLVSGVTAISNAAYINPATNNLVANGRFDIPTTAASGMYRYWGPYWSGGYGHGAPQSWNATGGGTATYGQWRNDTLTNQMTNDPVDTASPARMYFGNSFSTNIRWDGTWTHANVGWSTATWVMGPHSNATYGTEPLALDQSIATKAGTVYRLQFFAGREKGSGQFTRPGIAGLVIEGYQQLYFRIDPNEFGTRYTIDFVAKGSSTNLKFQNWGHPAGDITELALDTVVTNECKSPLVQPDVTSGAKGQTQVINLLTNRSGYDSPSAGETLVANSVKLCNVSASPAEVAPNCTVSAGTPVSVPGVGSYLVNSSGVMTFTPEANYVGTPPPIPYTVQDSGGSIGATTYTPTVTPPPMTANPDTTSGLQGAIQTINLTTNDVASSGATVTASSVKLCNVSASPAEVAPNCTVPAGTAVVVAGVGSYIVNTSGVMTFTPLANYTGTPTGLPYVVSDSTNSQGYSTYTPTVYGTPTATPDAITDAWDTNQTYNPVTNDTAGSGTTLTASSVRICVTGTAAASCTGTTLTVADQGTYTVNTTTGAVTFDPLPTFTGTATPIEYVVTDSQNQKVTSTVTPTVNVPPAPSATADTITSNWDVTQTYTPLSNDTANASFPLLASSVKLCAANETPDNCTQTTLTVANQGTYTVNTTAGAVTFDPLPTFTGTATPIKYQAKDSLNRFVDSTISPIIGAPPAPAATADAQTTGYDVTQNYSPITNDSANVNFPLDVTTVKLCGTGQTAPACDKTSLTTADGVYTVNAVTGAVEFNPAPTFTGTVATPINYQVTDSINRTVSSSITPTIGAPAAPSATPNTSSGAFDTNQTINPLTNDTANSNFPLSPTSVKLCGTNPAETPNSCTNTVLVIAGEGTYTVDPVTGVVTFDPLSTFAGTATPIKYQATDSLGRFVDSTIAVTVSNPPLPVANPNTSSGAKNATQVFNPLADDTVTSGFPLDPTSVKLCGTNPLETPNNCTKTTLTVAEGTFTVNPTTGYVTFVPATDYIGSVPQVSYVVTDSLGRKASSTIDITVASDPAMSAVLDTSTGNYNTAQTINPLTNDSAGRTVGINGFNTTGTVSIDATTVRFCGPGQFQPNCDKTTITNAAGTYTVNPTTGVVTFTPAATFTGTDANGPTYQVCNTVGSGWDPVPASTCATAQIIPTVGPPPVAVASADSGATPYDTNKTVNPLINDSADPNFPLDPTSVKLCGAGQTPNGCDKTTITVFGEGTYTVNPLTGEVTFDPLPSFTGAATPITYQVKDSLDRVINSTITVTVGTPAPAQALADSLTSAYDVNQGYTPASNDTANLNFPLDTTTVKLCGVDDPASASVNESVAPNCVATRIETVDGVYTLDSATGAVTFNPAPTFTGTATAPVTYQVSDSLQRVISSTITPIVGAPPVAVATTDTSTGAFDTNQTISPLNNDNANSNFPLVVTSVTLCGINPVETPDNCTKISLTTPDGVYTVNSDGTLTFNPDADFTGTVATPVKYQATDTLGRVINSTIMPTVGAPPLPTANANPSSGNYDVNQTINPLTNDNPGTTDFPLDPSSVKLCGVSPVQTPNSCTQTSVTVPGEGTYTVNPTTGVVTFDPLPTFTGTVATPIKYQVSDSLGRTVDSTITPTVGLPPSPSATADTSSGAYDTNQTKNPLTNDTVGSTSFPLSPTSVKLCGIDDVGTQFVNEAQTPNSCDKTSLVVPNQGTYTVDPTTGVVTFDPLPTFTGTATPVAYQANNSLNQFVDSTYTPTVLVPAPPTPAPDTSSAAWDVTQTKNVLSNDTAGALAFPLLASTVKLCGPSETPNTCSQTTLTVSGEGTYTVNNDGTISFDPLPTFIGQATGVTYQVSDGLSRTISTTYTPSVTAPPVPTVVPDVTSGPINVAQSVNVITNSANTSDSAAAGLTLVASSVQLSCPTSPATPACTVNNDGTVTITGQGTYSADANGVITFTPVNGFTGTAKPVKYTVTDSVGQSSSTTYTPTFIPPPTVQPDTTTAGWDVTQSINVVTSNTTPGPFSASLNTGDSAATGATLVAGSIRLCASSDTASNCTIDASGSVVIANQGTYTVDPATNTITFDPLPTFTGPATPVTYSIMDNLGQKSSTTYSPTVVVALPVANPETKVATLVLVDPSDTSADNLNFGPMHWTTTFTSVLQGNGALATGSGLKSGATGGPCLVDPDTNTCGTSVTIPREGVYSIDQTTGVVTFVSEVVVYDTTGSNIDPGPKTPVTYQVTDAIGRTVTSTLTPVIPNPPTASPDSSTGVQGATQTLAPVTNDSPGGGGSTTLYPDTRVQTPSGIFLCAANQPPPDCRATTVDVFDNNVKLGVLTVSASGLVTFTPEADFIGTTPPIGYQIPDNLGQKAYSTITITVVAPPAPSATIDSGSAGYNKPVTLSPWLNDSPGAVPAGSSVAAPSLVATSIKLCAVADPGTVTVSSVVDPTADCTEMSVTTSEGTYEVDPVTGKVVFTPVDGFVGTVAFPPTYQIWNNYTGLGGAKSAKALLVPTISGPGAPVAAVDVTKTKPGTSVVLNPVDNDTPGDAALDPLTIKLCGIDEIAPSCTQMEVTTVDGTYVVDPETGEVTFTPRDGFTGKATLPYVITDMLGMVANSNLIITVEDTAKVVKEKPVKKKTGLAKTGGHRPDLLMLFALLAFIAAGGMRMASRRKG